MMKTFLSGTVIEFSNLSMLSDAGGADARRRRLCGSPIVTTSSLSRLCFVSLMYSLNFAVLDLSLPVEISMVSYCWWEFIRVDLFSGDSWMFVSGDTSLHLFILHVYSHPLFRSVNLCSLTLAMKRPSEDPHRKRPQPHLLLISCVNLVIDVDGIPFRRPDSFLQSLIRLFCLLITLTFSILLSYLLSNLVWTSGKTCCGEGQSPSPTCLDGHLTCSGEHFNPPTTAVCLSTGGALAASNSYSRSTSLANEPAAIGLRFIYSWAWSSTLAEAVSPVINLPKSGNLQHIVSLSTSILVFLIILKILDGFIEVYNLSLLSYHSLKKQFSVDSPELVSFLSYSLAKEKILQPCLYSMNGDVPSDPFPSYCFSLLTGLLPCVAVSTGLEGAIKITSVLLVGEGWLSTSLVTKSRLFDFVGKALSTHSNYVSNSLSTSYEDLLCLIDFANVAYSLSPRGCLIPSCFCSIQI
ncbi:hypothetical protein N665_0153s0012 [Sinapis alba]|nr:hypothetical protein N665_0153s0012 [Sinapis alba]